VIKAESQLVLNTLTDHDFQDAFKKWSEVFVEGDYFKVGGGQ
jgi:hypothetical protein